MAERELSGCRSLTPARRNGFTTKTSDPCKIQSKSIGGSQPLACGWRTWTNGLSAARVPAGRKSTKLRRRFGCATGRLASKCGAKPAGHRRPIASWRGRSYARNSKPVARPKKQICNKSGKPIAAALAKKAGRRKRGWLTRRNAVHGPNPRAAGCGAEIKPVRPNRLRGGCRSWFR